MICGTAILVEPRSYISPGDVHVQRPIPKIIERNKPQKSQTGDEQWPEDRVPQ